VEAVSINILETDARQLRVILNTNPGKLLVALICIRVMFLCQQEMQDGLWSVIGIFTLTE